MNQEAIVHFEGKDYPASEWLKLVCGDRGHVAMVYVQADGDQRYDASDARRCNNNLDHDYDDCQHCGHPHGLEVEIVQGKDRAIFYLHPWCEAAYREKWGDKIINRDKPVADPTPPWLL